MAILAVSPRASTAIPIITVAATRWTDGLRCPDLPHSGEFL